MSAPDRGEDDELAERLLQALAGAHHLTTPGGPCKPDCPADGPHRSEPARGMFDAALSAAVAFASTEIEALHERVYQLERRVFELDAENLRLRESRRSALRAAPSGSQDGGSDA